MAQIMIANIAAKNGDDEKGGCRLCKDGSRYQPAAIVPRHGVNSADRAEFDTLAPQKIVDRLKPLSKPGHPWFGSAGEMTAIAYMKMGKDNLAGPIFAQIAKQEDVARNAAQPCTTNGGQFGSGCGSA